MKDKRNMKFEKKLQHIFNENKKLVSTAMLLSIAFSYAEPIVTNAESVQIFSGSDEQENAPINKNADWKSIFSWSDPTSTFTTLDNMNQLYNTYGVGLVPHTYTNEGIQPDYIKGQYMYFENIDPTDIKLRYENVATYRGQKLDVMFTFTDYLEGNQDNKIIRLGTDEIRLKTDGYLNTEWNMKIVKSGTNEEVPVAFILRVGDIDADQYMGMEQTTKDEIALASNTLLSYAEYKNYYVFGNYEQQMLDPYAQTNEFLYYDKSSEISGVWGLDRNADDPMDNVFVNFEFRLAPEPDTIVKKSVTGMGEDGIASVGETLNYQIDVTNTSPDVEALDVAVRDSLLEDTPDWLTFNDDVTITPNLATTGSLQNGDYSITELPAGETATITYSMTLNSLPETTSIDNIVTDNGENPEVCEEVDHEIDCDETITPIEGDTIIKKSVMDEDNNGITSVGETLNYQIDVTNTSPDVEALDVAVRDSLLEDTPDWLTFNDDVTITPNLATTGSLQNGDYSITELPAGETATITYSMTLNSLPETTSIDNIVTDNGENPEVCEEVDHEIDCDETITPIEGDTIIKKSVMDEDNNGIASVGETLNYQIDVTNTSPDVEALDVAVRDSLLEDTPDWLTFNDDVTITPNLATTGSLQNGDYSITELPAGETATITYSMTLNSLPNNTNKVVNIATDNGEDPEVCEEVDHEIDCDETIIPVNPETIIDKSIKDENENHIAEVGETLTYTIKVQNESTVDAISVPVRDSLLEETPEWLTFNDDVEVFGSDYSGSLSDGSLVLDTVGAKDTVEITYSMTLNSKPSDTNKVVNIATDNGADPEVCEEADKNIDCDETIIPVNPETIIDKSIKDENENHIAEVGETLTYTIKVQNESTVDAISVPVRDSLLEETPEWLTFNDDVEVFGSDYSGSLSDGSLVLDTVGAKDTVEITYSMTLNSKPSDTNKVVNIATDNGADPDVCEEADKNIDCDETIIPVNPETIIDKSIKDENENHIAEVGETLTYTIKVQNESTVDAISVPVRDSLLEETPEWLTFNDDVEVFGSDYSGSLSDGSLVLDTVGAKDTVEITYSMTLNSKPSDTNKVVNIATDNGADPDVCEEADKNIDCDETIIPVNPETIIDKSIKDENENHIAEVGETLTYTIKVQNESTVDAISVPVRDSLLEETPEWLTFNDDVEVFGSDYSGSLSDGSLVLDKVGAKDTVEITYSMTLNKNPLFSNKVVNIATDNGADPDVCEEADKNIDCDETIIPMEEKKLPKIELPHINKPEVVEPEVVEPKVVEPKVVEPEVVEPKVVEPEVVEPEVVEPEVVEPEVVEPEVVEPEQEHQIANTGLHFAFGALVTVGTLLFIAIGIRKSNKLNNK